MFIYSRISWYVGKITIDPPVVKGYYHSLDPWNEIKAFYVDRWQIPKLIQYYKQNSDLGISIVLEKDSNTLVVTKGEKSERIMAEKIQISHQEPSPIWCLSFCDKHFDVEVNDDERTFTHVDIMDAVLHGIKISTEAGQKRVDFIDGLIPKDCAILYANDLEGS
jgi:hypothetical protein